MLSMGGYFVDNGQWKGDMQIKWAGRGIYCLKTQSHMEQGAEEDRKERAVRDWEEGKRKIFSMGKKPVFHEIPDSCIR